MKPDWDRLLRSKKLKAMSHVLIADVDCTDEESGSQQLCQEHGVKGYPTLKYGDPNALENYEGERSYKALLKFAKTLKPLCSPQNKDVCDDESRTRLEDILAMSDEDIVTTIQLGNAALQKAENDFKEAVEELQRTYERLQKENEEAKAAIKESGLGLYKSVAAFKKIDVPEAEVEATPANAEE